MGEGEKKEQEAQKDDCMIHGFGLFARRGRRRRSRGGGGGVLERKEPG